MRKLNLLMLNAKFLTLLRSFVLLGLCPFSQQNCRSGRPARARNSSICQRPNRKPVQVHRKAKEAGKERERQGRMPSHNMRSQISQTTKQLVQRLHLVQQILRKSSDTAKLAGLLTKDFPEQLLKIQVSTNMSARLPCLQIALLRFAASTNLGTRRIVVVHSFVALARIARTSM